MIASIRLLVDRLFGSAETVRECRNCGRSVDRTVETCPECGATEISRYRIE